MSQQQFVLVLFQVVVLVLAFSVHESAHAYAAMRLGDPTAYMLGRVTLNPMKHLDPVGSVLVPLFCLFSSHGAYLIGWAKPCPMTTRNFRHIRRDDILTSLAGPASNLAMATAALVLLIVFKHAFSAGPPAIFSAMATANHIPVDTSALPLFPVAMLLYYGVLINLLLFVFNLIPIPPLDGSHVLRHFLPYRVEQVYNQIGMYGLIVLLFFGGHWIWSFYSPLMNLYDPLLLSL